MKPTMPIFAKPLEVLVAVVFLSVTIWPCDGIQFPPQGRRTGVSGGGDIRLSTDHAKKAENILSSLQSKSMRHMASNDNQRYLGGRSACVKRKRQARKEATPSLLPPIFGGNLPVEAPANQESLSVRNIKHVTRETRKSEEAGFFPKVGRELENELFTQDHYNSEAEFGKDEARTAKGKRTVDEEASFPPRTFNSIKRREFGRNRPPKPGREIKLKKSLKEENKNEKKRQKHKQKLQMPPNGK